MTDTPKQLFIGGAWLDAAAGATLPVDDPATGEDPLPGRRRRPRGRPARREAAAVQAQEEWAPPRPGCAARSCAAPTRSSSTRTDELALLMTPRWASRWPRRRGEVAYAAEFFRWFSEEAVRIDGG